MPEDKKRTSMSLRFEVIDMIEEYQEEHRLDTRSEAVEQITIERSELAQQTTPESMVERLAAAPTMRLALILAIFAVLVGAAVPVLVGSLGIIAAAGLAVVSGLFALLSTAFGVLSVAARLALNEPLLWLFDQSGDSGGAGA